MRGYPANGRGRMPVDVRRHPEKNDGAAFGKIVGKLCELRRLDERDAILGQKVVEQSGVLHADERAKNTQDAGRQAKVETDAIRMAGPCACTGTDDHLVAAEIFDDLLDQRKNRDAAAIDKALAANL